jgi:glycyl-tRNA synthetase beta chain
VAQAIYDHYKPQSQEDARPKTIEGAVLSIADKADSIAGMFALGKQPTGSKDPFALRRQANGIVKTVAEHELKIGLRRMLLEAREIYRRQGTKFSWSDAEYEDSLGSFFRERLEFYLREVGGFAYDVVNAVLAGGSDRVVDAIARATALQAVRNRSEFEAIALSFKRIKNILRQAYEKGIAHPREPDAHLVKDEKEQELLRAAIAIGQAVESQRARGDYEAALSEIAKLRAPLDAFFDHVMVMVDDTKLRANRLALLAKIMEEFSTIADFSEIVTERVQAGATSR